MTENLRERLSADDEETTREAAAELLDLAIDNPSAAVDYVPSLATCLEDSDGETASHIVGALGHIAREHPEEIRPAVPQIVEALDEEDIRADVLFALGMAAKEYPNLAEPLLERYHGLLDDDDRKTRNNALAALVDFSEHNVDSLLDDVDRYVAMLDDPDDRVRCNATIMLRNVAREHGEHLDGQVGRIAAMLHDTLDVTQARAARTLGHLQDDRAVPELEEMAERHGDDQVQDSVRYALDRIEHARNRVLEKRMWNRPYRCSSVSTRYEFRFDKTDKSEYVIRRWGTVAEGEITDVNEEATEELGDFNEFVDWLGDMASSEEYADGELEVLRQHRSVGSQMQRARVRIWHPDIDRGIMWSEAPVLGIVRGLDVFHDLYSDVLTLEFPGPHSESRAAVLRCSLPLADGEQTKTYVRNRFFPLASRIAREVLAIAEAEYHDLVERKGFDEIACYGYQRQNCIAGITFDIEELLESDGLVGHEVLRERASDVFIRARDRS